MAATGPRTAVIVDDHAGFRAQAARMLEAAGYQVVGSCPDAHAALALLATLRPDLVLVDVQLPGLDGFALVEQLSAIGGASGIAHGSIGAGRVADATGAIDGTGGMTVETGATVEAGGAGEVADETGAGAGTGGMTLVLVSSREAADYGSRVGRSGAAGFITKAELSARSLAALVEVERR